jgi:hypothetical protein
MAMARAALGSYAASCSLISSICCRSRSCGHSSRRIETMEYESIGAYCLYFLKLLPQPFLASRRRRLRAEKCKDSAEHRTEHWAHRLERRPAPSVGRPLKQQQLTGASMEQRHSSVPRVLNPSGSRCCAARWRSPAAPGPRARTARAPTPPRAPAAAPAAAPYEAQGVHIHGNVEV